MVSNTHYAYGPFGVYVDNFAANIICAMFVDRTETRKGRSTNLLFRQGNKSADTPHDYYCPDNIEAAIERAISEKSANAAYAVALAISENDPVKRIVEQLAWIIVSARLGNEVAKVEVAKQQGTETYIKAEKVARDLLKEIEAK